MFEGRSPRAATVLIAGFAAAVCLAVMTLAHSRAKSTERTFSRVAKELPFISYGYVLRNEAPREYSKGDEVTKAWEELQSVMKVKRSFAELVPLADHANPKVRTLALLGLYALKEPRAFRIIHAHSKEGAETFPTECGPRSEVTEVEESPLTRRQTVGHVAGEMLGMIGFPPDWQKPAGDLDYRKWYSTGIQTFEDWSAMRLDNPDWIGWYDFLYHTTPRQASAGESESASQLDLLRKQIGGLPLAVRTWMWFGVADDEAKFGREGEPLATDAQMIEAAKQLGPDALLTFLQNGSRAGLREPRADDPARGRRFILLHAKELFRKEDAEKLLEMRQSIAAADANPAEASMFLHKALREDGVIDEGLAVSALVDLCGEEETDFAVRWFYDTHNDGYKGQDRWRFIGEIQRRKTEHWWKIISALVAHPNFESLDTVCIRDIAQLVNQLGGKSIFEEKLLYAGSEGECRAKLREYFGLSQ